MTEGPARRRVTSASELVKDVGVSIKGITFFKVAAEIREDYDGDFVVGDETVIAPNYGLKLRSDDDGIGVRLNTHLVMDMGSIDVDAAIDYIPTEQVEIPEDVLLEFANEVGLMAILPYAREAIGTLSARVFGRAILMPVVQRGQLSFTVDERDAK